MSDNRLVIAGFTRISNLSSHRLATVTRLESALHLPFLPPLLTTIITPMHCLMLDSASVYGRFLTIMNCCPGRRIINVIKAVN